MVAAVYEFKVDTARDGTYSAANDDLTSRLIGSADFNFGMNDASQDFATPARLTVQLDNSDGAFNPDTLGAELLTNGDFAHITAGHPDNWTVAGENGTHVVGAAIPGIAFSASSSGLLSISQTVLTVGQSYIATISVNDVLFFPESRIRMYTGTTPISPSYSITGTYTVYFTATSTAFKIATDGESYVTITNVSVKATAVYGNVLSEGVLCRLRATFNAVTYVLFVGRLTSFTLTAGSISRRIATLVFSDPTLDLLDTEYAPTLYTNVTPDVPMAAVFDAPVVPFPYASNYWILGAQGSSELEISTYLYSPPSYSFDTGKSTYSWVGDNAIDKEGTLKGQGTSAQTFLRDLVAGEVGGRFFYDPALPGYRFHNRHRDPTNTTVAYTIADGDYEPDMSVYVREPVLNHSVVSYQPRKTGTAGSVIWRATNTPLFMAAMETKTFTARYVDINNPSARVGATDVIPLAAGTDYIVVDNLGIDVSSSVGVSMTIGANSATINLTNGTLTGWSLTYLQVRGTPITTFDAQSVESVSIDSERAYKRASERINYNLIDTDVLAQNIADYRVYKNSVPVTTFEKLGFIANKTDSRMVFALAADVGNRITLADTWLNHTADYFIVGGRHQITWGGDHTHSTTFTLKPALREAFWILGTSLLDTQTRLGL